MAGRRSLFSLLFWPIIFGLSGCGEKVPDGRIRFRNDSRDSEYNVVKVSAGGSSYTLHPTEATLLPRGTRHIAVSRAYRDYTRRYEVECPGTVKSGFVIKLIDVHLNRMSGGCKTIQAGKD